MVAFLSEVYYPTYYCTHGAPPTLAAAHAHFSKCDTSFAFFVEAIEGDAARQHTLWIVLGTCRIAKRDANPDRSGDSGRPKTGKRTRIVCRCAAETGQHDVFASLSVWAVLALAVNLCTFGLIGRTSAIT